MNRDEYIKQIQNKLTSKDWAKIKTAKQRKDCAHLYDSSAVDGVDYQECPITNKRMASITGRYIKTLPTTEEEYFHYFPELKEVPEGRKEVDRKAKQKLYVDDNGNHILNESGQPMTVVEVNIMRKMETMRKVDEDGLTGIQKAGMKSRESHMNNIDEYGMNGYQQQKLQQFLNGNGIKAIVEKDLHNNYDELLSYITYKSDFRKEIIGNTNVKMTRDSKNMYVDEQVDHIYSKSDGFYTGQSPFMIGSPKNCRIVTIMENQLKQNTSFMSLQDLYNITGYTRERSEYEYNLFKDAVSVSYKEGAAYSNLFVMVYMYQVYSLHPYVTEFREMIRTIIKSNGDRYK